MILQALLSYYERKAADPDGGIAPDGFGYQELPFVIVLDSEGNLVQIEDTREQLGKELRAKSFLVPKTETRTSGVKAYILWDNVEYVLGICVRKNEKAGSADKVAARHAAFVEKVKELRLESDEGVNAVLKFLSKLSEGEREKIELPTDKKLPNPFVAFRLDSDTDLICQRPAVIELVKSRVTKTTGKTGVCLVSGERTSLANLEPEIKGVKGTQTSGAKIVSFNDPAFCSFGKKQGENAPISKSVSFSYTTALNYLLRKDSAQKLKLSVGDATTVFWSDKATTFESEFPSLFDEPPKDDPDRLTNAVRSLYRSVDTGAISIDEGNTKFFVLGLSPNAARISVRFWHTGTVTDFSKRIAQYFHDLEIVHGPKQREFFSIWHLLRSIAVQQKTENIPPNLAGEWMRSILAGLPYPETLFQSAIRRIRAERNVSYPLASILKACVNRKNRFYHQSEKEITVALDTQNRSLGYRMGRLFAALEKIQEDALPGIKATIRDRYYSAASGTPASVMPILMRLKNHHLAKLEKGKVIWFEKQLAEILSDVSDFPLQLNLQEQGRFAIGYYHQRQAFFTKSQPSEKGE